MKKKTIGRAAALAVATAMVAVPMTACSSGSGSNSGEVHLLSFKDNYSPVEQQLVDQFNKTSKVKIVVDTVPAAQYNDKLRAVIDTPQAPDIFYNWGSGNIEQYVKKGLVLDLSDQIKKDPTLKSAYLSAPFGGAVIDGKPYGIPARGMGPVVFYYNKTLLDSLNLPVPKTWDQLISDSKALSAAGKTPIDVAGQDPWTELMWLEFAYDRALGPQFFDKIRSGDTKAWKSPESLQALNYVSQLLNVKAFGNNFQSVSYNSGGATQLFAGGNVGFELQLSGEYGTLKTTAANFVKTDLGWTAPPAITGGKGDPNDVVGSPSNYYSVTKKAKNVGTIVKFLDQLSSDQFVNGLVKAGALPVTTSMTSRLGSLPDASFDTFQFNMVKDAPHFQSNWDQELGQNVATPMYANLQKFFGGQFTAKQFANAMASIPESGK